MKHRLFYLEALLLSLAAAWGAIGCLVTAFEIPVERPEMAWALLAWAVICIFLLSRRRGVLPLLILSVGILVWLIRKTPLRAETLSLLGHIVKYYDQGYGIGIPEILQTTEEFHDLPLTVYAMTIIAAVSRTVCRRKGSFCAVGLLLIPLMACLVVTDTVPEIGCLFALLLSLVLLLLTDSVRGESGDQGTRLSMTALVPAALCLALLFHFVPREQAVNPTAALREQIVLFLETLPQRLEEMAIPAFDRTREEVDLASLGSQPQLGLPIAEVTAETDGTLYLRVQDYDHYTGTSWESTAERAESLSGTGEEMGRVTVQTTLPMGALLLPAFPKGETLLDGGNVPNENELRTYTYTWMANALGAFPTDLWLTLPVDTAAWAQEVLKSIPGDLSTIEGAAAAIGSYVSASAEYSRRTETMTQGSGDFAQWFLNSAERGYCVHFATTAAVLLRAAGIPARYVTGYKAELIPDKAVKITSDDAHAWVEYYNYRTWTWSILEATPSALNLMPEEPETVTIPQPTDVPEPQTEPVPIPEPTSAPTESEPLAPAEKDIPWKLIGSILGLLLSVGLIHAQRWMRLKFRLRRRTRGTTNRRALAWWREVQKLGKLIKKQPPEELSALAEKAMFSQHQLTEEELEEFSVWAAEAEATLMRQPIWKRAVYRYWYAVL